MPLDILQQKINLKQGLLLKEMNRHEEATNVLRRCLDEGEIFDARVRVECIQTLRSIVAGKTLFSLQLDRMLECFKHTRRDFIFLVNIQGGSEKNLEVVKSGII